MRATIFNLISIIGPVADVSPVYLSFSLQDSLEPLLLPIGDEVVVCLRIEDHVIVVLGWVDVRRVPRMVSA